jgi:hypothetical protein
MKSIYSVQSYELQTPIIFIVGFSNLESTFKLSPLPFSTYRQICSLHMSKEIYIYTACFNLTNFTIHDSKVSDSICTSKARNFFTIKL